jgi:hypothetical protein
MSLFRDKWGGYVTASLAIFTSGITIYLLVSDTARRSEINRRKKVLSTLDDENSPATTALEKAQHRFGILRVGGRFVNPFDEYGPWRMIEADLGQVARTRGLGMGDVESFDHVQV